MADRVPDQISDLLRNAALKDPGCQAEFLRQAITSNQELSCQINAVRVAWTLSPNSVRDSISSDMSETALAELMAVVDGICTSVSPRRTPLAVGAIIGNYEIREYIASGGMGAVYKAEQLKPVHRCVALKLLDPIFSGDVIARFEGERQVLAAMDHRSIPKMLEAGTTETGCPYVVMEYVDGVLLTDYCDRERLGIQERIELFVGVCWAAVHAHQKGVIHRDLKPGNILVAHEDGRAIPKVIDFGIAKAIRQQLYGVQMEHDGAIIGTREYMSPEQASLNADDIDSRSDIYSLGAVLYELLIGVTPHEFDTSGSLHNAAADLQIIREVAITPPSVRVKRVSQLSEIMSRRRVSKRLLQRLLSEDLDWIVMKAMAKDRNDRYASVDELMRELQRYLGGYPVEAHVPSARYSISKFAQRHWLGLSVAGLGLVAIAALVLGGLQMTVQTNRAKRQAQAVLTFLQDDLLANASANMQANSGQRPDPELKVRTVLDRAAKSVEGKFPTEPLVEATIRETIGNTYRDIGRYSDAEVQIERAAGLRRRILGSTHLESLRSLDNLAAVYESQGKYPQAEALFTQVLGDRQRVFGPQQPETLATMSSLAEVFEDQAKYLQAEMLDRQVLETKRRVLGSEHPDTLMTINDLAVVYEDEAKYVQAEALYRQVLETRLRLLGPEHPLTLASIMSLAGVYHSQRDYSQVEALLGQVLETRRRVLGPEHPETQTTMNDLGVAYEEQGKYPEAERIDKQVLEMRRRTLGPEHPDTLTVMNNLAVVYRQQGNPQAEVLFAQILETTRRVLGPEHPNTVRAMHNLATVYAKEKKHQQSEMLFLQALAIEKRVEGPEHPHTLTIMGNLAGDYRDQGRYHDAEALVLQVLEIRRRVLGLEDADTLGTLTDLAIVYELEGKYARAEPLLRESLAAYEKKFPDAWERFRSQSLLGVGLAGQKKYPEAEIVMLEGYRGMLDRRSRVPSSDEYTIDFARKSIVKLYESWGKPDKAAAWRVGGVNAR